MSRLKNFVNNHPSLQIIALILKGRGDQVIILDYSIRPTPRYGYGKPPHPLLFEVMNNGRLECRKTLENFLKNKEYFKKIPARNFDAVDEPCWINDWLPGLDSVALYSFLCARCWM